MFKQYAEREETGMATSFKVTISEMRTAARRIDNAAKEFEQTAERVLWAAERLGASWEGDSQVAFILEQHRANIWYKRMMKMVRQHVVLLNDAAKDYQESDNSAAAIIRGR